MAKGWIEQGVGGSKIRLFKPPPIVTFPDSNSHSPPTTLVNRSNGAQTEFHRNEIFPRDHLVNKSNILDQRTILISGTRRHLVDSFYPTSSAIEVVKFGPGDNNTCTLAYSRGGDISDLIPLRNSKNHI